MRRRLFLAREKTRAFEHDVHAERAPRQLGRVAHREHLDAVAINDHRVAVDFDLVVEPPVRGVVTREVRVGLGIAQIVDGDDPDIVLTAALVVGAQDVAADAAVTIDGDVGGHGISPGTGT